MTYTVDQLRAMPLWELVEHYGSVQTRMGLYIGNCADKFIALIEPEIKQVESILRERCKQVKEMT